MTVEIQLFVVSRVMCQRDCADGVFYVRRTVDRCVFSFYEVLKVAVWQIGETADQNIKTNVLQLHNHRCKVPNMPKNAHGGFNLF